MTYVSELANITRKKIDLVKITLDYCSRTFGTAPCTASVLNSPYKKCYNTFPTCQDTANYNKTTKIYKFVSSEITLTALNSLYGCKPYIKSVNDLPTEVKETDTVVKRLKLEMMDENDNDVGIDAYVSDRIITQGTFWKKFLARNKNYKGRLIELYEGFEGIAENDFVLKFAGSLDNIELSGGVCTIEAVDLMKELSKINYPFNTNISVATAVPNCFRANSDTGMLSLKAVKDDYCLREDKQEVTELTANHILTGSLPFGYYDYQVVEYASGRPVAISEKLSVYDANEGSWTLTWKLSGAGTSVRLFRTYDGETKYISLADVEDYTDSELDGAVGSPPEIFERIYQLTADNPSVIGNWTEVLDDLEITLSSVIGLNTSGYIKINKEIIGYTGISTNTLTGVTRLMFSSTAVNHSAGTVVYQLLSEVPDNPFSQLKKLLGYGGIAAGYISDNFDTLSESWSGPYFGIGPVAKETKLNKIYFDLVNAVNCISFVGEDGKIEIVDLTSAPGAYEIGDEGNFILGSVKVDQNEDSRKTRFIQYWNRVDYEKGIEDREAYNRITITIDTTAESANEFNEEVEDLQYSAWFNVADSSETAVGDWIDTLLEYRRVRMRNAQTIFEFDTELKDNYIKVGDVVLVTTRHLQDEDGENFDSVAFRIVKKSPKGSVISFKAKRKF